MRPLLPILSYKTHQVFIPNNDYIWLHLLCLLHDIPSGISLPPPFNKSASTIYNTVHLSIHLSHRQTCSERPADPQSRHGIMILNAPLLSLSHSNGRALAFYPDTPLLSGLCHLDQWHVPPLLSTHLACLLYVSNTQHSRRRKGGNAHTMKVFYTLHIHLFH